MPRFLAILQASDPQLAAGIEAANGRIVAAHEPGVLIIDGDGTTADAVRQLQAVRAVGPVDGSWDVTDLDLDAATADIVGAWNRGYSEEFVAAANLNYRADEPWDFPGGCFHSGIEGDDSSPNPPSMGPPPDSGGDTGGLVASAGDQPQQPGGQPGGDPGTAPPTDDGTTPPEGSPA